MKSYVKYAVAVIIAYFIYKYFSNKQSASMDNKKSMTSTPSASIPKKNVNSLIRPIINDKPAMTTPSKLVAPAPVSSPVVAQKKIAPVQIKQPSAVSVPIAAVKPTQSLAAKSAISSIVKIQATPTFSSKNIMSAVSVVKK